MAGQPTFQRAKRFTFFHTSYVETFEGSYTQHVKTNLTASIDGNFNMKADTASINANLDMMRNKILRPKNVLRTEKVTVTHANLTKTATQYVKIYRASPGDSIANLVGNLTTRFGLTATRKRTYVQVGDVTDLNGFAVNKLASATGWKWSEETNATKGAYFKNASGARVWKTLTAGMNVRALFTASDMYLASLNAGSIDFYLDVMSRA